MNRHLCAMRIPLVFSLVLFCACGSLSITPRAVSAADAPGPLLEKGKAVDWWFVYKFNAQTFPLCGPEQDDDTADRACPFGGKPAPYKNSQQFVFASSAKASFTKATGCAGTTDPVGTTLIRYTAGNSAIWSGTTSSTRSRRCTPAAPIVAADRGAIRKACWPGMTRARGWSCRSRRHHGRLARLGLGRNFP